jgi:uncharacterized protein
MKSKQKKPWTTRKKIIFSIGMVLIAIFIAYCFIEPYLLQVDRHTIESPEVPDAFNGYRIVFASDLHYGPFVSKDEIDRVVDLINAQDADIVILGGDYVKRTAEEMRAVSTEFVKIKASMAKYAIMGNHDYWAGKDVTVQSLQSAGFTMLINQNSKVTINGEYIYITGLDDLDEGQPNADVALADIQESDFDFTALHNPKTLDEKKISDADIKKMDAAMAGHTHGGQFNLFGLWSPGDPLQFPLEYGNRWHNRDGLYVLTSNGTGVSAIPVRFCAWPEINVITLKTGAQTIFN